jgi:hypothetical protein
MTLSFFPGEPAQRPPLIIPDESSTPGSSFHQDVSQHSHVSPGPTLSDQEREAAIVRAGQAIEKHMASNRRALLEYDITNSLLDKADADGYRLMAQEAERLQRLLISGRSPAVVARMEAEQAERMRLEPGAELA